MRNFCAEQTAIKYAEQIIRERVLKVLSVAISRSLSDIWTKEPLF